MGVGIFYHPKYFDSHFPRSYSVFVGMLSVVLTLNYLVLS